MNRLADEEQASKDAAMLAAEGDGLLLTGVAWDFLSDEQGDRR